METVTLCVAFERTGDTDVPNSDREDEAPRVGVVDAELDGVTRGGGVMVRVVEEVNVCVTVPVAVTVKDKVRVLVSNTVFVTMKVVV